MLGKTVLIRINLRQWVLTKHELCTIASIINALQFTSSFKKDWLHLRVLFYLTELTEFESQAQGRRAVARGMQHPGAAAGQCSRQLRPARAVRSSDSPSFHKFQVVGCGKLMMPDCQSLCWSKSSPARWEQRGWKRRLRGPTSRSPQCCTAVQGADTWW